MTFKKLAIYTVIIFILLSYMPMSSSASAAKLAKDLSSQWQSINDDYIISVYKEPDFNILNKNGFESTIEGLMIPVDGKIDIQMGIPDDGKYLIALEYKVASNKVLKNTITLSWNNDNLIVPVQAIWEDQTKNFPKDRYGNEVVPQQQMYDQMHVEYVTDFSSLSKDPYIFYLKRGQLNIKLHNNTQPIILSKVYLIKYNQIPAYKEYAAKINSNISTSDTVIVQAEDYAAKSDPFIRPGNKQNMSLTPYDTTKKLLNIIDGASWKNAGDKVLWTFNVPQDGIYYIGFRYSQSFKEGLPVFRDLQIDGLTLFSEMNHFAFPYTGLEYRNMLFAGANDQPFGIWLKKGEHSISMTVNAEPLNSYAIELKSIMNEINDTGIDLNKLVGSAQDAKRTWDINQYMPDITTRLNKWADELDKVYSDLGSLANEEAVCAINIKLAASNLRELAKHPDTIPAHLTKLNEGSGSAAQLLGDVINTISEQPMSMDCIYISAKPSLPSIKINPTKSLYESIKRFVFSFMPQSKAYSVSSKEVSDELSVWVNRPIQYVEMLQQMADTDFTPKSGINVKFSVMPDEQKLILASAARIAPDIAMGISNYIPFNLGLRGAALDLTEFDDFLPYISRDYNLETLIPFYIDGKIYGVTETQDFYVLFYRKDILDKLHLSVPQTWKDVEEMMPELQRNSMNFYVPMAGWSGLKPLYTTVPFIFQNGGSIYTDDGLKVAFNQEDSLNGFNLMTELFNVYSLAQNVPNFYNDFRYGRIPIGVSNFSTYVMLMNAAPEIADKWDIALSPGVEDKNGNILRYQVGSDRADVIFSSTNKKQEAWTLLKWWLSKDTQVTYAYNMQTRYGPEYMWNTANMSAFEELPFPDNHKKVILEQWKWIKEVPKHPAEYMVEREISNAWTSVVMDGESTRIALDKAAVTSNREIMRKLDEFGYTKNGKVIKPYHMPNVNDIKSMIAGINNEKQR